MRLWHVTAFGVTGTLLLTASLVIAAIHENWNKGDTGTNDEKDVMIQEKSGEYPYLEFFNLNATRMKFLMQEYTAFVLFDLIFQVLKAIVVYAATYLFFPDESIPELRRDDRVM